VCSADIIGFHKKHKHLIIKKIGNYEKMKKYYNPYTDVYENFLIPDYSVPRIFDHPA